MKKFIPIVLFVLAIATSAQCGILVLDYGSAGGDNETLINRLIDADHADNNATDSETMSDVSVTPASLAYWSQNALTTRLLAWLNGGTITGLSVGDGNFTVDAYGNVTAKSYTTTKVSNTATQILLYGDNGTQTLGAGWMGPHDTTARTANYYVRMPTEEPTDGQVIAAGTPSEHIAGATWVTPIRAGVTEITKYQYLPAAWFEDNATSPPAAAAVISGEETKARLFADNETSIVLWQVDPEWSAGLKFRVYYSLVANGEANDTAIFRLKGCTVGNSEALTCTAGDPIGVTDELGTDDDANELMITDWSDAVTLTGIAANELARLTFYRGSDDEAGELNVIGIELKYKAKVSAASDY